MPRIRILLACAALAALPVLGAAGTAAASTGGYDFDNRCDVAIVDHHGDVIRFDEKSHGTRIDGFRCDDGVWRYDSSGRGHERGDFYSDVLFRER